MNFILRSLLLVAQAALCICSQHLPAVAAQEETCLYQDDDPNNTTGSCTVTPTSMTPPSIRIMCYGDSLTAGESPPDTVMYPYADWLHEDLAETMFVDDHIGLCGWTTRDMLGALDHPTQGLRHAISKHRKQAQPQQHEYELLVVVILAGTNDLWPQNLNPTPESVESVTQQVVHNLMQLHQAAWDSFPRTQTVAIGIPNSVYQERENPAARIVRERVNQQLLQAAQETHEKLLYLPFPFDYDPSSSNWSYDGIHFSKKGYEVLGHTVAKYIVENILQQIY